MISTDKNDNLTVVSVTGEVTAAEIVTYIVEYMDSGPTKKVIWDFTDARNLKISTLEVKAVVDNLKALTKDKESRRVALVGSKTINIGLGKLFAAFAQMANLPNTYKVFRNVHLAEEWLAESADDLQAVPRR